VPWRKPQGTRVDIRNFWVVKIYLVLFEPKEEGVGRSYEGWPRGTTLKKYHSSEISRAEESMVVVVHRVEFWVIIW
jgi:hypothetical protein